ncbi:MAG: glycerate kinase [bacterium]|nr:glycerate kinase [bacterium]
MRKTQLRKHAESIFRAGLDAVHPARAVEAVLRIERTARAERLICGKARIPLSPAGRIILIGAGKAAPLMARGAENVLGRRIAGGLIVVPVGGALPCRRVEVREAAHPIPDAAGVRAAREIARWTEEAGPEDVLLLLLSGGGSALLTAPAEGLTLADKKKTTALLLRAGAPIDVLNCVRKHLSTLKGGQLGKRIAPARGLVLYISDVVGDRPDTIASGPACGDPSTFADAQKYMKEFRVWTKIPARVRRRISAGSAGKIPETPSPSDHALARIHHVCAARNGDALQAAAAKARSLGYRPRILTRSLEGEAREAGRFLAAIAREMKDGKGPFRRPACLLAGGETTVTVQGRGRGGRNQELALSFALEMKDRAGVCLLAAGTDGRDGPTPAAGAFVDGDTIPRAIARRLAPSAFLANNDSHGLFQQTESLITTGPTGTNVMDMAVLLVR